MTLQSAVPVLDILLRIREDMLARPAGPYRYIGVPDVDQVMGFILGYREVLRALGVEQGPDVLFGPWLRDVRQAWPGEGWEAAYLRECEGDQTRAVRKYLDYVAEFRALPSETLSAMTWLHPEDAKHATRAPQLRPTRTPPSTLDFLLEMRREIGDDEGRLFLFIGPIEVKRMAGFIAGYRLCLGLVGARDEEYVRFERWLQETQGVPEGEEWTPSFLAASGGDPERAIRRLLECVARFRASPENGWAMKFSVSHVGYHVVVRMQERADDAYTGASGMPWAEYLSRLGSRTGFTEKVVETVGGAP